MTLQIRQEPTLILYNVHLNYQHHRSSQESPFLWSIWIKTRSSLSSLPPYPGLTPSNLVYLITSSNSQQHVLRVELWSTFNTITGSNTLIFNFPELLYRPKLNTANLKAIVLLQISCCLQFIIATLQISFKRSPVVRKNISFI